MVHTIQSEKNGAIRVERSWRGIEVWVGGCDQTTLYTNRMWKMALLHVPKSAPIKHVLLLGLGSGGIMPALFNRYPKCRVTVVEWDPAMIDLAKKNIPSKLLSNIEIISGDASVVVPSLTGSFDCIIIDLFRGKKVSPVAEERSFAVSLRSLLKAGGYMLANFFSEPDIASTYVDSFSLQKILRYYYNRLFVFRPFGAGVVGSRLPDGYTPYRMCRAYMKREAASQKNTSIMGSDECPGYRTRYGGFCIDKFFGDGFPIIEAGKRLVVWRPFTRDDHPSGWFKSDLVGNIGLTGVATIDDEYWKRWDRHAQRHRNRWLKQKDWTIEEIPLDAFLGAYMKTRKEYTLKLLFSATLKRKIKGHGSRVRLIGARRRGESAIRAGFASLTIPESRQAVHLISFIHDTARGSSAGVGMMDDWFLFGLKNGLRFLDFGLFWKKGEPKVWKPWSNFKSQFSMHYIMHPKPLARMMWK